MSGHSKWSKIKHQKAVNDAKKGSVFTRHGKNITIAAKEGGGDPKMNFRLAMAIEAAKSENMPMENIERSIKKGTGELKDGNEIMQAVYEGYGPGGVPMLVDVATDNSNRSVSEIRKIFSDYGGNLGESGVVSWQFEERGLIVVRPAKVEKSTKFGKVDKIVDMDKEEVTLALMEINGIFDITETEVEGDSDEKTIVLEVFTERNKLAQIKSEIEELGYIVESAELIKVNKSPVEISENIDAKIDTLIERLEEHDDVQNVWDARK